MSLLDDPDELPGVLITLIERIEALEEREREREEAAAKAAALLRELADLNETGVNFLPGGTSDVQRLLHALPSYLAVNGG